MCVLLVRRVYVFTRKHIKLHLDIQSSSLLECVYVCVCVLLENAVFVCVAAMVHSHHEPAGDLAH